MQIHRFRRTAVCELQGRLLYENLPELNTRLEDLLGEGLEGLIIKLDRVLFLDSSALGMLLSLSARASARGARFRLMAPPENLMQMFASTRLDEILEVLPEEEARAIREELKR